MVMVFMVNLDYIDMVFSSVYFILIIRVSVLVIILRYPSPLASSPYKVPSLHPGHCCHQDTKQDNYIVSEHGYDIMDADVDLVHLLLS